MSLLASTLQLAVPMRIWDFEARGGPSDTDFKRASAFGVVLAEKGDVLQFGGKPGEAAGLFNQLADAVAVLAFVPGGVKVFGEHYEGRGTHPPAPHAVSALEAFLGRLRALQ